MGSCYNLCLVPNTPSLLFCLRKSTFSYNVYEFTNGTPLSILKCGLHTSPGVKARMVPDFGTPSLHLVDRVYDLQAKRPHHFRECVLPAEYKPLRWDKDVPRERLGCDRLLTEYQSSRAFVAEWSQKRGMGM